jgi:hypothetical protein
MGTLLAVQEQDILSAPHAGAQSPSLDPPINRAFFWLVYSHERTALLLLNTRRIS